MSNYVSEKEIKQVQQINMLDYVKQLGYEVVKQGKSYRIPNQGGLFIDDKNNRFNCFAIKEQGGGIIQLAMFLENKKWLEAIHSLMDRYNIKNTPIEFKENEKDNSIDKNNFNETNKDASEEVVMPQKGINSKRVFAYLNKSRYIDNEFIQRAFDEKLIYQSNRGSLIIRLKDENNNNVGAFWQNTVSFDNYSGKGNKGFVKNSKKEYPFEFKGTGDKLYICESPIDMMSYLTIKKIKGEYESIKDSSFIATWGINSEDMIKKYLKNNPHIKEINICYDNDINGTITINGEKIPHNHGQEKAKELQNILKDKYMVNIITPEEKDFNDVLKKIHEEEKIESDVNILKINSDSIEEFKKKIDLTKKIDNEISEVKMGNNKTDFSLNQLLEEEKELKERAKNIINKSEELINEFENLKNNYEKTIARILENKEKQMSLQKENYKYIIKNNAYVMIRNGIDINIVHESTKVEKEELKRIQQEVVEQTNIDMYGLKENFSRNEVNDIIDYGYNQEEEQEELYDVLEKTS